jgi:uncharacterized protein involved in exopolysaccharide biosynthesis
MKRMDAVRLEVLERAFANMAGKKLVGLVNLQMTLQVSELTEEVRASHRDIQDLKTENERLREQIAAEGRQVEGG